MPKKILSLIILFLVVSWVGALSLVRADGVTMTLSPPPPDITTAEKGGVKISITGLRPDTVYSIGVTRPDKAYFTNIGNKTDSSGNFPDLILCSSGFTGGGDTWWKIFPATGTCSTSFPAGAWTVDIRQQEGLGNPVLASASFNVSPKTQSVIKCTNTSFTPTDNIVIALPDLPDGNYRVQVDGKDPHNLEGRANNCKDSKGGNFTYNLGTYAAGAYTVIVYQNNGNGVIGLACDSGNIVAKGDFKVSKSPSDPGGCTSSAKGTIVDGALDFSAYKCGTGSSVGPCPSSGGGITCDIQTGKPDDNGSGVSTVIGCVPTDPKQLIAGGLKFITGISGAGALLIMGFAAFGMITSSGNAEALKHAQERFYSAIIGLLFIVFSVFFLQVLGVDILNLPGFGK